jgi:hypothetical protein
MKLVGVSAMLLLLSLVNSCKKPIGQQTQVTTTCACDEFPFPKACSSMCETGEVQIESVNAKEQTAMIVIQHGALSERQTIPWNRLPVGVPAERGASFTALLKKEASAVGAATSPAAAPAAAPSAMIPRIVRFTKKP